MSTATTNQGEIHRVHHDGDGRLSDTLVDAVADLTDTAPADLPPLETRINVPALDALWETDAPGRPTAGCLTFTYGGYVVVVRSTGVVLLRETTDTG
ncbi:HalOD1 output domain-containing protein [Haloplanus natans]|uniref:HalOD1 output domain-containing protein n=1 Tax=Haloplanus natans TaxID=376171 RepID=UPI00067763CD|nr:HalOD1 output domain-containing protein [Haloplanus natans]